MKKLFFFLFVLSAFGPLQAQMDDKFVNAMSKNIAAMDTAQTGASWQTLSNNFERIAQKESKQWLPQYYVAFCQFMVFNLEKDASKYEPLVIKAEQFVTKADSLEPNNAEIHVLRSMIAGLRIRMNPMVNGQKFGPVAAMTLEKAKMLDPDNPRSYMQEGITLLFTPPQWGGDKAKAKALLEKAKEKFEIFKPASSIHPNWGKEVNNQYLEMASK